MPNIQWTKTLPTKAGWYWVKATWVGDEYPRELVYVVFVSPGFGGYEVNYFAGRERLEDFAKDATAWSLAPIRPNPVDEAWNQGIVVPPVGLKTYHAVIGEPHLGFEVEEDMDSRLAIYNDDVRPCILASEWQLENGYNFEAVPVNVVPEYILQPLLEAAKDIASHGDCDCDPEITDPCSLCILRATLNDLNTNTPTD